MRELSFLNIIKNTLTDSSFLNDDCAFLEDLGVFVTQDTLVEDVHFSMHSISPYLLGRKSVAVNLSDLAASLSLPKYITISISLPKTIKDSFVSEFYKGVNDICSEYSVIVVGGDITGSDKIIISITALGKKNCEYKSSRAFAKKNDCIVITGNSGSSAAGLYAFQNFLYADSELINAHLNPVPRIKEALKLSKLINSDIAVMDTSDGLVDALYKIAYQSKHTLFVDFSKVPVSQKMIDFASQNNLNYKNLVKWGGEDYELLACIPEDVYENLDKNDFVCIGKVLNKDNNPCVIINDGNKSEKITENVFNENSYDHF